MIGLDSNVLVRFLTHDDPEQTPRAVARLAVLTADDPGYLATVVAAETYWVLTRAYRYSKAEAGEIVAALSRRDEIRCEDEAAIAYALNASRDGADFADALIAHAHRRAGCTRTVTFDQRAASRLGFELI